jgi:hypothetical protein
MILADTSVWVDHLRYGRELMQSRLEDVEIACHAFVIGELACGNLGNRREILALLHALPRLDTATDEEVFELIERARLWGYGAGWIDMHLIASALISGVPIWTRDRRLSGLAAQVGVAV